MAAWTIALSGCLTVVASSTAAPHDKKPPSTPTNLQAGSATTTGFTVNWTASTDNHGVAGYDVSLNGAPAGTTTATTKAFSGLTCGNELHGRRRRVRRRRQHLGEGEPHRLDRGLYEPATAAAAAAHGERPARLRQPAARREQQAVRLHGVNYSGTEYACIQGWGIFDGPCDDASVAAIRSWNANVVHIGLNEDCIAGHQRSRRGLLAAPTT